MHVGRNLEQGPSTAPLCVPLHHGASNRSDGVPFISRVLQVPSATTRCSRSRPGPAPPSAPPVTRRRRASTPGTRSRSWPSSANTTARPTSPLATSPSLNATCPPPLRRLPRPPRNPRAESRPCSSSSPPPGRRRQCWTGGGPRGPTSGSTLPPEAGSWASPAWTWACVWSCTSAPAWCSCCSSSSSRSARDAGSSGAAGCTCNPEPDFGVYWNPDRTWTIGFWYLFLGQKDEVSFVMYQRPPTGLSGLRSAWLTAPDASSKLTLSRISQGQWTGQQREPAWRRLKRRSVYRACVGRSEQAFAWSWLCWTKVELFLEGRTNCRPLHTPDSF